MTAHSVQPDQRRHLSSAATVLIPAAIVCVSLIIGLGTAQLTVDGSTGFGGVNVGIWRTYPRSGTYDVDPYARAAIIRRTELPLGVGEGIAYTAQTDSSGLPLNGRCLYRIIGLLPHSRAWTLAVHTLDGKTISQPNQRYYLTSGMVVYEQPGYITINAASFAQAGNWLSLPHNAPFVLVFRFYDIGANMTAPVMERMPLPDIQRSGCQ